MENENSKIRNLIITFIPLILAIAAVLFLFGNVLTYCIKYVPEGASDAVKEYFGLNIVGLFDPNVAKSWPMITILTLIACGGIIPLFTLISKDKVRENLALCGTFCFLFALAMLAMNKEIFVYYGSNGLIEHFKSADVGWATAASLLCCAAGAFASLLTSGKEYGESVKGISEDGVLIAAAFVLNFVKLPIATGGGSINFQMLPLFIIALRRGPLHGFISGGIVYGLLTCLTDGYGFMCYPFDYLIAFGSVAVLGFFKNKILGENTRKYRWKPILCMIAGCVIATAIRFIGSTTSSMVIYGVNIIEALTYNAIYIPVSGAIALAVLIAIHGPLVAINKRFPVRN